MGLYLLIQILKRNTGQGLIEALVALGAAVIVISTIAVAVVTALNNSDFSKNQNLAKTYAEQGVESIRTQARQNWTSLSDLDTTSTYCLAEGETEISVDQVGPCSINIANFVRSVRLSNSGCSTAGKRVSVEVAWTDGKCSAVDDYCHEALLETCLENINRVPTP